MDKKKAKSTELKHRKRIYLYEMKNHKSTRSPLIHPHNAGAQHKQVFLHS